MILAALAFFLQVDGGTCVDVRCVDDIPAPTPTPTSSPRPTATPKPTVLLVNCPDGDLNPFVDFIPIAVGQKKTYCIRHPADSNRLTIFSNDRSGINLCGKIRLTTVPPPGSGQNVQAQEAAPADITTRYFAPPVSPRGTYIAIVEGLPGSCPQAHFRLAWTDR